MRGVVCWLAKAREEDRETHALYAPFGVLEV